MWSDLNARKVILARFISRTGGEAAFFVGLWGKAAYEFEATPVQLAVLMAVLGLASLLGSAVAGVLIDRTDPRRVLVAGEILFVPVALSAVFAGDLVQLTVVAGLIGLFSTPVYTAIASFPPFLTDDERRLATINAGVESAGMVALISGTAAGAILVSVASLDAIFVFDALTSAVGAAVVWRVALRRREAGRERAGGWAEIRRGFGFVYSHHRLRFYMLLGTSTWLIYGLFSALEPLFYRDVLERGPATMGWVNTVFGAGLVAGTVVVARLPSRLRGARAVVALTALNGAGALLYVGTRLLPVVTVGGMMWGFVIGLLAPMVRTLIHLNSPEELMGRIMGTTQVHGEAAKLVPLLLAPGLAAAFGVQATLAFSGLILTVIGAAAAGTARRLDRTRDVDVPPVATGTVADEPLSPTA